LLFVVPKALDYILLGREKVHAVGGKTPESLKEGIVCDGHPNPGAIPTANSKARNYIGKCAWAAGNDEEGRLGFTHGPSFRPSEARAGNPARWLEAGETVQWELLDRGELHLVRLDPPQPTTKKRAPRRS
jgi:hypothetical protein